MKVRIAAIGMLTLALLAPAGNQGGSDPAQALRHIEEAWNHDFASKDASKLIAHYSEDGTLMSPGMPAAHGKQEIGKVLSEMVSDPALSLKFQPTRVEVSKSGDLAFTEGTYTLTMTNPATKKPFTDKGSYVTVHRKQSDKSWKAVSDIASSEAPARVPAS